MKTYNISRLPNMLCIGFDGENNWRPQAFDCTPLLQNHPNGTISLWILPNGESQAFPVALERDGNMVVWTPLSEELTASNGALQIVCIDGTDVGKSAVAMFRVDESILPGADHPAEVPSWAIQTVERAESAADRAEEAAESIDIESLEARIAQAVEDYLDEHPVSVTVDSELSSTSENPVQNKVIKAALDQKGTYSKPSGGIPASDLEPGVIPDVSSKQDAPLEIPVTESDGTYSTTATAEQIRAAKENSVFVFDGEARIKALLWFPTDEDVDLLIGMETFGRTIMSVAATVSNNSVSIRAGQTMIPTDTSDLTNGAGFITMDDVPAAVTEQTVSGWGFTKNTGTYSKPSGGIPKSDLAQAVQTSLGKADSALQQHQSLAAYQTKAITDTGNYYNTDTVDGALQEIGAELSGINTLIGSGVIS